MAKRQRTPHKSLKELPPSKEAITAQRAIERELAIRAARAKPTHAKRPKRTRS